VRKVAGHFAVGIAVLVLAGLSWSIWVRTGKHGARNLREAIERGRLQLRQGKPELATHERRL
jgi:hypothetical protein